MPKQADDKMIRLLQDGTVLMREEIMFGLLNIVAANCEEYAGDRTGDIVGAVMATCAGYAVGSLLKSREDMIRMRENLIRALDAGLADGTEDNKGLPKLNG